MAEQKVLISKATEFGEILDSDEKDAQTYERKNILWHLVAGEVKKVNLTRSKRTAEEARNKWKQIKCKNKAELEALKK